MRESRLCRQRLLSECMLRQDLLPGHVTPRRGRKGEGSVGSCGCDPYSAWKGVGNISGSCCQPLSMVDDGEVGF